MTLTELKTSRRVAELTLQNLGLEPSQVDQLQKILYSQLNEASEKALKKTAEEQGSRDCSDPRSCGLRSWTVIIFPFNHLDLRSCTIKGYSGDGRTTLNEFPTIEFDPSCATAKTGASRS